jgi:hypothetical protein
MGCHCQLDSNLATGTIDQQYDRQQHDHYSTLWHFIFYNSLYILGMELNAILEQHPPHGNYGVDGHDFPPHHGCVLVVDNVLYGRVTGTLQLCPQRN